MDKIICGIYKITSPTNRVYIGQSEDIKKRFDQYRFISNTITQTKLHRSFLKHSITKHTFEIIEECKPDDLLCRERHWQNHYDVLNGGLNCLLSNCGDRKVIMSEEIKLKISHTKKSSIKTEAQKKYDLSKFGKKNPKNEEWQSNNDESRKKPITQNSLNGDFIKDWKSAKDVEDTIGFSRKAISKNLRGKSKSSMGYIWKYKIINKMDEFLKEGSSYERLLREYKEHGSLVVGFDFDGTVHDYHKSGATYESVRQLLRNLKGINCKVICWTAYEKHEYVDKFLKENNIPCDGININGIPLRWETRKPFFSVLLDDRAGLIQVYNDLTKLVDTVKNEIK